MSKTSPWFPGGLLVDLEKLLGCKVDVVTEDYFIKEKVLNEAIKLSKKMSTQHLSNNLKDS